MSACRADAEHILFVNVTANTGRLILSSGYFGSPKILLWSGIRPDEQLQVVADSGI